MGINITSALSALDSSTSLVGLGVKDSATTAGLTGMAYKTGGEHEAREKFIDEFGTGVLWLCGIPVVRKLFDKTVFKWMGLDPEISLKKLKDFKTNVPRNAQEMGMDELWHHTEKLGKIARNSINDHELVGKYKIWNVVKFLVSTTVPSLLIIVLPKLNQRFSRKIILNRALREQQEHTQQPVFSTNTENKDKNAHIGFEKNNEPTTIKTHADNFFKNPKKPAFSGVGDCIMNAAAAAQVNPVGNILLVDAVISGNRVTTVPRNNQQRQENGIKEGGWLFFAFFAQDLMKKGFEKLANRWQTPVELDFKTLNPDKEKNKAFVDKMNKIYEAPKEEQKKLIQEAIKFTEGKPAPAESKEKDNIFSRAYKAVKNWFKPEKTDTVFEKGVVDFVHENYPKGNSIVLQTAKQVKLLEEAGDKLDSRKYIDTVKIKKLSENIGKFAEKMLDSKMKPEDFMRKARNLKAGFLAANLAICTAALGILLPKIQYTFRKKVYGSNEYPGVRGYAEEAKRISKQV